MDKYDRIKAANIKKMQALAAGGGGGKAKAQGGYHSLTIGPCFGVESLKQA